MYSAARYEFRSFPDLRLNGPPLTLKTEDAPIRWLNGGAAGAGEPGGGGREFKLVLGRTHVLAGEIGRNV